MAKSTRRYFLIALFIIILLILAYSIYYIITRSVGKPDYLNNKDQMGSLEIDSGAFVPDNNEIVNSTSGGLAGSGGSSGDSGGGSSGSSGGGEEKVWVEPFVKIIKPVSSPSVDVSLNYLNSKGASLRIVNQIGESSSVLVRLADCPPELSGNLEIDEEKDFVFNCNINGDYFDKDLFITYSYGGLEPITVYGVVRGSIS